MTIHNDLILCIELRVMNMLAAQTDIHILSDIIVTMNFLIATSAVAAFTLIHDKFVRVKNYTRRKPYKEKMKSTTGRIQEHQWVGV